MSEECERDEWVRALVDTEPRSFVAFEALAGHLHADLDGKERFGLSRFDLDGALDSASLTFDPSRGPGPDPALEAYRLCVRLPLERALAVLAATRGGPTEDEVEGDPAHRFGSFTLRPFDTQVLLDWSAAPPSPAAVSNRQSVRTSSPTSSPPCSLRRPPLSSAMRPTRHPADAPPVTLTLDPPADAPELCRLFNIAEPLAVSHDVHQQSWALPSLDAGRWTLRIGLKERPAGPLPTRTIGASPAYDVLERGGDVTTLDVTL